MLRPTEVYVSEKNRAHTCNALKIEKLKKNMKRIILLLLCVSATFTFGQVATIKLKKYSCDFKLVADNSIVNTQALVSAYMFSGVTKKEAKELSKNLHFFRMAPITINKDSLAEDVKNACETNKKKLNTITIKKTIEKPHTMSNGETFDYVRILLTYKKNDD